MSETTTPKGTSEPEKLLEVRDLGVHFPGPRRRLWQTPAKIRAVDGITLTVGRGETLGIVGESGSGKSTLGRAVVGLHKPTSGTVRLAGTERGEQSEPAASSVVQMIFQDPYDALNPRMEIGLSVAEPLRASRWKNARARHERVIELLELMGFDSEIAERYPHEFSGGQLQRVVIARALSSSPSLIVCDEPTSALDVSTQASLLNLLADLKRDLGLAYLFISHDLGAVRQVADRVAVVYGGRVMEYGPALPLMAGPLHPYTAGLVSAAPSHDSSTRRPRLVFKGEPYDPSTVPSGCRFASRCPFAQDKCRAAEPELRDMGAGRSVACIRAAELQRIGALNREPEPA